MTKASVSSRSLAVFVAMAFLAACGGGGGGGSAVSPPTNPPGTAVPTAAPVSIAAGSSASTAALGSVAGQAASLTIPATSSGSGNVSTQLGATQPAGTPTLQSTARAARTLGGSPSGILFVTFTPSVALTFTSTPSFTFTFPAGFGLASGAQADIAFYDPTQANLGWQSLLGPGTVTGSPTTGISITFASVPHTMSFAANQTYVFSLFSTAPPVMVPTTTPTPTSTTTPVSSTAYNCPSSATSFGAARSGPMTQEATRRAAAHPSRSIASTATQLAVTYDLSTARATASAIASHERSAGATLVQSYDFPATNSTIRVVSVTAAQAASAAVTLRSQAGVTDVSPVGRRHKTTVTAGYFPNDPYFNGFNAGQNTAAGQPTASPTFHVAPYEENANVPGQWDMHIIGLENAFAYSQSGNGSGLAANANALGSSSIKIAIIDTGEDPNHPELASKIAVQKCFITNPSGSQSTGNFSTDPDGHGTDVSGIAAASMANNVGFVGAGGNVKIVAYRVFPTPDDSCGSDTSSDAQCSVDTRDIAAAINDAVTVQHVNVISMSLGGGVCGTGAGFAANGDNDTIEGNAVAAAIAANVIVVAAAGNDGSSPLEAPACDTGVIAVGATSLADGQPNGKGNSNGTAATPIEYVASYSDWGSPAASPKSSSAWGIVAPGGDPNTNNDNDDLHWIEHIWTSTPFLASAGDTTFTGNCGGDYGNSTGTPDCRTLIAGTSMATPHVAGAAALILSVNASYGTPAAMKALLCSTADDIGDAHEGCGRLNIYRAMATALNDPVKP